jgi:hypothetical protein
LSWTAADSTERPVGRKIRRWQPVVLASTAVVTLAAYHLVEKPFNRLKDRFPQ